MTQYDQLAQTLHAHDCIKPGGEISTYNSIPGNVALGSWSRWQQLYARVGQSGRDRFVTPMNAPRVSFRALAAEMSMTTSFIDVVAEPVRFAGGGRGHLVRLASAADEKRLSAALDKLKD